jgi:methylaspartate mutase epsilon subunit
VTEPLSNARLSDEAFAVQRREVLAQWPALGEIDLTEAFEFHRTHMAGRNIVDALHAARADSRTLVQPRAGVATREGLLRTLRLLQEAGADILPVTVDSFTRTNRYEQAQRALEASTPESSKLNGYPIVNHGVEPTREVLLALERPVHMRANATDLRLVAELGFATGMTGFVSGPMYSTMWYTKDAPLGDAIRTWQYVFRLIAEYTEGGIPIVDDAVGFSQSGTYSVPALMHAGVVLDALIMAGQGVKTVLAYAMSQGTLAQDVAACHAVGLLTEDYLKRLGFADVEVFVASNNWNGVFPEDEARAYGLIAMNSAVAALARASVVYVKSIEEGVGVPTAEGNAASVRTTRYVLELLRDQVFGLDSEELEFERALNLIEGRAILDAVLTLGDGDPAIGAVRAFEAGVLDVPFAPSNVARGDVLVARDARGAVRFLDYGNVPIPAEARAMEQARLAVRARSAGHEIGYDDIIEDVQHLATRGAVA